MADLRVELYGELVGHLVGAMLTPTENRATFARRVLGLVATLHQNSECENYGTSVTKKVAQC